MKQSVTDTAVGSFTPYLVWRRQAALRASSRRLTSPSLAAASRSPPAASLDSTKLAMPLGIRCATLLLALEGVGATATSAASNSSSDSLLSSVLSSTFLAV